MGNNASTPQAQGGNSSTRSSSSRHPSPKSRQNSLPTSTSSSSHPSTSHSHSIGHPPRKKKSIDMDVVPSSPAPRTHPSRSLSATSSVSAGSSARRKGSDRIPVVDEEEADLDPDPSEEGGGGTLRGALQGKAEHVVYGPRRDETSREVLGHPPHLPAVGSLPSGGVGVAKPSDDGAASKPVAMAIPGVSSSGARTPAGGHVGRDGSLTNAGMGAIGAMALPEMIDPDDTTHPGFSTAPRLTSAVLMSTDKMPVIGSPMKEYSLADSPFRSSTPAAAGSRGGGGGGGGSGDDSVTPTQERPSPAVPTPQQPSYGRMLSDDLAATLANVSATFPAGNSNSNPSIHFQPPQTSFASAASSIFAPTTTSLAGGSGTNSPIVPSSSLLPPHTSSPSPPQTAPHDTVLAPPVPSFALPIPAGSIPSGTSVIASPTSSSNASTSSSSAAANAVVDANLATIAPSPVVLLPPAVFNARVAAIPIPLLSVPSPAVADSIQRAAVDLGAGAEGVPTLIKWKDEDGQIKGGEEGEREAKGPREVFVTGTFANGWKTKIELRKTDASDFAALISLPPGPHRLKFIVDNEWKASKNLPVATDADGNLINYLQINPVTSIPPEVWTTGVVGAGGGGGAAAGKEGEVAAESGSGGATLAPPSATSPPSSSTPTSAVAAAAAAKKASALPYSNLTWPFSSTATDDPSLSSADDPSLSGGNVDPGWAEDSSSWTQQIPSELVQWGEWEAIRDTIEADFYALHPDGPSPSHPYPDLPPPPPSAGVPPPSLPAQLEKGPLNHAAYVTQGSGDDNSILPKPDHSVINHLAASPIKGGFLSVGVTTRYKRKFVTIVYYKALASR